MKQIKLKGETINYEITYKDNKNTYFYFKEDGYIKVNASSFQTEQQICQFMIKNEEAFLSKINKAKAKKTIEDDSVYYLWGNKLKRQISRNRSLKINVDENNIYEPNVVIDQRNDIIKRFELNQINSELANLYKKYENNPFVNIKGITIKARYTKTRFGSCNAVKRNININANLVHYDKKFLEYVFLHEISHLTHQNHGPKFYKLLEKLCPSYKELRKELKLNYKR